MLQLLLYGARLPADPRRLIQAQPPIGPIPAYPAELKLPPGCWSVFCFLIPIVELFCLCSPIAVAPSVPHPPFKAGADGTQIEALRSQKRGFESPCAHSSSFLLKTQIALGAWQLAVVRCRKLHRVSRFFPCVSNKQMQLMPPMRTGRVCAVRHRRII